MSATDLTTTRAVPRRKLGSADLTPGLLMIAPAIMLLFLFLIGPFFLGIAFSFTNQRLISANPTEFVGLRNYSRLLSFAVLPLEPAIDEATGQPARDEDGNLQYPRTRDFTRDEERYPQYAGMREWVSLDVGTTRYYLLAGDPTFLRSLVNIIYFALVVVPLQSSLGLALALLINRKLRGINVFRTLFFSPVVTSMVVISIVWTFIYEKNVGLMNQILSALTFGQVGPIDWLGDERFAMPSIMLMSAWQGVGFQMVLFLAGLQGIPESHYEAASIDGANAWQQFRYITIPGLRNVMIFILITITIAAFQLFTQPFVMTNGGPNDATTTVAFHMVREGFREQDIAYASTIAVVFFLLILSVSMIQRYLTRDKEA